jgi:hypothetical protein
MYATSFIALRVRSIIRSIVAVFLGLAVILFATSIQRGATAANIVDELRQGDRTHELPREWRWEKPSVDYEHIYMSRRGSDRSNTSKWIRESH